MTREPRNVKDRVLDWLEDHPYTGWYIAACATINVILNLLDLFH